MHQANRHGKAPLCVVPNARRRIGTLVALMLLATGAANATTFDTTLGDNSLTGVINTNLSVGAQWRVENRSNNLISKTKVNPHLCPVAPNGDGTSCQGDLDYVNPLHASLNSYVGEGPGADEVAVKAPGQFSNNADDGDINYNKGDLTQAVGKLAMDLTAHYHGFDLFIRGYGFYDAENNGRNDYNPNIQTVNTTSGPGQIRRGIGEPAYRARNGVTESEIGVGAKLLDYYVSTKFPLGEDRDVSVKLGAQNINWGESTLLVIGSLNSFSTPNVNSLYRPAFLELSEVLEPTPALLISVPLIQDVTLDAFYQYAWQPATIPPAGSYLSTVDIGSDNQRKYIYLDFGKTPEDPLRLALPDQIELSSITTTSGTIDLLDEHRAKNSGQFGFTLKYYAEWLNNGTDLSLYAGQYHSRLPFLSFYEGQYGCLSDPHNYPTPAPVGPSKALTDTLNAEKYCPGLDTSLFIESSLPSAVAPAVRDQNVAAGSSAFTLDTAKARLEYPENIQLYGLSFNTAFGAVSVQGEVAYRPAQPLQVATTDLAFAALQNIFPRGNGSGTTGDSYDFGVSSSLLSAVPGLAAALPAGVASAAGQLTGVGTLAQLPGARYGIPDFVSKYRGRNVFQNGYLPGEYIRGWQNFQTLNYDFGATGVIGPGNGTGADQIILIGELGMSEILGLPSLDKLQIEGPGTFTHASAGADGSGANGSARANSALIGPSGIRFNPTQQVDGFTTSFATGYRVIGILKYENVLPGIGVEPTIIWSQDVYGVSPGPGENFVEGRKSIITSTTIRLSQALNAAVGYTTFFGGGKYNLLADRDFVQVGMRYLF